MHRFEDPLSTCLRDCIITQALSGLCVGLVLTNADDRVLWMNRTAERVLGAKARECLGRPLGSLLHDLQLISFWEDAARADGNVLADVVVRWPEHLSLKVNATRYVDATGGVIGRALLFCDVTAERAVQVELSEEVANRLLALTGPLPSNTELARLTAQELRILRLVGRGLSNDDIAAETAISTSTVRSHLKHIYRKLSLNSRAEAVSYAARQNLT